jgi:hypothetical protein
MVDYIPYTSAARVPFRPAGAVESRNPSSILVYHTQKERGMLSKETAPSLSQKAAHECINKDASQQRIYVLILDCLWPLVYHVKMKLITSFLTGFVVVMMTHHIPTLAFNLNFLRDQYPLQHQQSLIQRYNETIKELHDVKRDLQLLKMSMDAKYHTSFDTTVNIMKFFLDAFDQSSPDVHVAIEADLKKIKNDMKFINLIMDTSLQSGRIASRKEIQESVDMAIQATRICARLSKLEDKLNSIIWQALLVQDSEVLQELMVSGIDEDFVSLTPLVKLKIG